MKVLIATINFSPELTGIGPIAREYADTLTAVGHQVMVVTGQPHYPMWRKAPSQNLAFPFEVRRCWHYIPSSPTASKRILYEATFAASMSLRLPRRASSIDLAIGITPALASTYVVARWAASRRIPFAAIVQDVVSHAAEQTGTAGRAVGFGASALEAGIFTRATRVGIVSEGMRAAVVARGAQPNSVSLLPNWPVGSLARIPPRDDARRLLGFGPNDFVCIHAGNIGAKQGLEVVIEAGRLAGPLGGLRFVLIGDGNQREQLERRAKGVDAVQFWPLLAEDRFLAALAAADVLLLTQRQSVTDMAFPSKLTTYARTGTPIVASVAASSAAGRALDSGNAALIVEPERPDLLLAAILELRRDSARRMRLIEGAQAYYSRELDPQRLRTQFLRFVVEAASA